MSENRAPAGIRITSYNVCYTKLLRLAVESYNRYLEQNPRADDRLDVVPLLPDQGEQLVEDPRAVVGEGQDRVPLLSYNFV